MFDKIKFAQGFRSYHEGSHSTGACCPRVPQEDSVSKDNPILDVLFAPDPLTGVPRSDLAFMFSSDRNPQIEQFIRDTLMRPTPSVVSDDADMALDMVKDNRESLVQYAERLKQICLSDESVKS